MAATCSIKPPAWATMLERGTRLTDARRCRIDLYRSAWSYRLARGKRFQYSRHPAQYPASGRPDTDGQLFLPRDSLRAAATRSAASDNVYGGDRPQAEAAGLERRRSHEEVVQVLAEIRRVFDLKTVHAHPRNKHALRAAKQPAIIDRMAQLIMRQLAGSVDLKHHLVRGGPNLE